MTSPLPSRIRLPLPATVSVGVVLALLMLPVPGAEGAGCAGQVSCPYQDVSVFGKDPPAGSGVFRFPQAIAFTPGGNYVFVADQFSSVVQKFTRQGDDGKGNPGRPVLQFGFYADKRQFRRFGYIGGLATDRNGHVYVLDSTNDRVQVFNSDTGEWVGAWGSNGSNCSDGGSCYFFLGVNGGIAVFQPSAADPPVAFIADQDNHRIEKFVLDSNGLPLGTRDVAEPNNVPVPIALRQWGSYGQCGSTSPTATPCKDPTYNYKLNHPQGVAVDPQAAHNVFVADDDNHRVVEYSPDGLYLKEVGVYGTGQGQFRFPYDVGVDNHNPNYLYVADNNNHRVQEFLAFDFTFRMMWGVFGPEPGNFEYPRALGALADDPLGGVYVADTANNRIQGFDVDGHYKVSWGIAGRGPGYFTRPSAVTVDGSGNVYVADTLDHRIEKLSLSGTYLDQFGYISERSGFAAPNSGNGEFNRPYGIAFDSKTGHLWIADTYNNRIQEITTSGTWVATYGGTAPGTGPGQFNAPRSAAVDAAGNLYVADTGNNRIQKRDFATKSWSTIGGTTFSAPSGVAVSASGSTLYVADTNDNRVQKFNGTSWTDVSAPTGTSFDHPAAVFVDGKWLYVSDTGHSQLLRQDSSNGAWDSFGTEGPGLGSFVNPAGVATSNNGDALYVTDTSNNRVQKFSFQNQTPDFTVSATPSSQSVPRGGTATYTVTVSPTGGFNSPVCLSLSASPSDPSGGTYSFAPNPASNQSSPSYQSTLSVPAESTAKIGRYSLTVAGTATGTTGSCPGLGPTRSTAVTLQVKRK